MPNLKIIEVHCSKKASKSPQCPVGTIRIVLIERKLQGYERVTTPKQTLWLKTISNFLCFVNYRAFFFQGKAKWDSSLSIYFLLNHLFFCIYSLCSAKQYYNLQKFLLIEKNLEALSNAKWQQFREFNWWVMHWWNTAMQIFFKIFRT